MGVVGGGKRTGSHVGGLAAPGLAPRSEARTASVVARSESPWPLERGAWRADGKESRASRARGAKEGGAPRSEPRAMRKARRLNAPHAPGAEKTFPPAPGSPAIWSDVRRTFSLCSNTHREGGSREGGQSKARMALNGRPGDKQPI
eukprot:scaffold7738_cov107-Isochrysis_galbana.AAC.11